MSKLIKEFVNEKGNQISMSVSCNEDEVVITAEGPDSQVENTFTYEEARVLRYLVIQLEQELLRGITTQSVSVQ